MGNTLNKIFIFAMGAAVGSLVTYKLIKEKYKKIADDEIKSVKEVYDKKATLSKKEILKECHEDGSLSDEEYVKKVENFGYGKDEDWGDEEVSTERPYVIEPEEFGECDYDTISLVYYEDGVVTDSLTGEVIDNVDDIVGLDSLNHFGEYEDDSVFVRNNALQNDYEILLDTRKYFDIHPRGKGGLDVDDSEFDS